jgi:hypothetical protein
MAGFALRYRAPSIRQQRSSGCIFGYQRFAEFALLMAGNRKAYAEAIDRSQR